MMRILQLGVSGWLLVGVLFAQISPHQNLDLSCDLCHTEQSWTPLRSPLLFQHEQTGFPLENAHEGLRCNACHDIQDFSRAESRCGSCHTDPHESAFGFQCERCHETTGWQVRDLQKVHQFTTFSFVGPHAQLDCEACHRTDAPQDFTFLMTQCISCHQNAYEATTDPAHADLGFPYQCELCHTMFAWKPAGFRQHDSQFFPIYSGSHAGTWATCADCHPNSSNYTEFTCLTCHDEASTNAKHGEVSGYVYDSQACYQCHPTGSEEEGEGGDD